MACAEAGRYCIVQSVTFPWAGRSGLMHENYLRACVAPSGALTLNLLALLPDPNSNTTVLFSTAPQEPQTRRPSRVSRDFQRGFIFFQ
jgi:hypothetical protein